MKIIKKTVSLFFALMLVFALCSCDNTKIDEDFYEEYPTGDEIVTIEVSRNPQAEIKLTDGSVIKIELRYDAAPNAVANFIAFANENVYNNMCFNEVRNNCILMTGYSDSSMTSPYYVQDELQNDGESVLSHVRGTVSMIRTANSDTVTGQFFVLTKDKTHFDKTFTPFGTVTEGMDVIDRLASSELDDDGKIISPVGIESVKINTFGEKFPLPTIILK